MFKRSNERTCMRRPKGIKTRKSVSKRFKITATGKVLFGAPAGATCFKAKVPNAAGHCERQRSLEPPTFIVSNRICHSATECASDFTSLLSAGQRAIRAPDTGNQQRLHFIGDSANGRMLP